MDRRTFLGTMLAACAAPAIVRADSLMRIVPIKAPYYVMVCNDPRSFYGISLEEQQLEDAMIKIAQYRNDTGEIIAVLPTKIITTREFYRKSNIPRFHSQFITLHP